MIELRVLGRTDLRVADEAMAPELLAQPRPTALLVYLAIEQGGVFWRRDKLASLFWPETDQEHARGNLRKLVHLVRKSLGEGIVEARGDEEIRLAPERLWCDAAEFGDAIRGGRLGRALELYKGPLLPGFFVSGAAGFQEWLDSTRRSLGRRALKAVLQLADMHAANGERTAAGDLIHVIQNIEAEIDDEHQLRKVLVLLDGLGDRAGAVRIYERFRKRLFDEYQVLPAPETRALIERIKKG